VAISTRWSPSPVTRPAHSPSTMARPSSSRPSSRKNSIVAARSSTTMPMLSIRLTAMCPIYNLSSALTTTWVRAPRAREPPPFDQHPRTPRMEHQWSRAGAPEGEAHPDPVEIDHALRDLVGTGELVLGAPFGVEEAVEREPFT